MLPFSLRELAKSFEIPIKKGVFPYKFVSHKTIDYIGVKPDKSYYEEGLYDTSNYKNWSTKEETLKYLKKDLLSLLSIIEIFSQDIFGRFNILLYNTYSLGFKIFKKIFLKNNGKYPNFLPSFINDELRKGYFGGYTDIFYPKYNFTDEEGRLKIFDINSLYPSVAKMDLPLGPIIVSNYISEPLKIGLYKCKISLVGNMKYPFLLYKDKDNGLIAPTGKWHGFYTNEEIEYARELGYKIHIYKGYYFNDQSPFLSEFIDYFYNVHQRLKEKSYSIN